MRGPAHLSRPKGRIGLDWMMVTVALIAGLLVAGAVVRTETSGAETRFGAFAGGMRTIGPTNDLVAFETYDFDAGGWADAAYNNAHVGLGGIVGPMAADAILQRDLPLPEGSVRAVISFDLIAIDDWALGGLVVSVDGEEVLTHRVSTRPDLQAEAGSTRTPSNSIDVTGTRRGMDRERGFSANGPADYETIMSVQIAVHTALDSLSLQIAGVPPERLAPLPATPAESTPLWALDNLTVVAERLP